MADIRAILKASRLRQTRTAKIPRDHESPAIFHVCRFQHEKVCSRVRQQRNYFFEIFYSFCYNYQPVLKPSNVLFIFVLELTGLASEFKQKGRKKCEKGR